MFDRIPDEMKSYRQWVVWRLEERPNAKPTKVPYSPHSFNLASVTNPGTWGTFEEACAAYARLSAAPGVPVPIIGYDDQDRPQHAPVGETGVHGIGFVLTTNDPYGFIDLDDTHGDATARDRQVKVFREFNSYSELSPSGEGLHIIVKASLPHGRRRSSIEIYSNERYMTMTGNVYHDAPIEERQDLLQLLFDQMGGPAATYTYAEDQPEREPDHVIVERAMNAANGDKFGELYAGDWTNLYPSQSEADFALVDIVAYYTQNRAQIARIFRASNLGKRDKAQRNDYVAYMVNKSFDRLLPPVDIDGLRNAFEAMLADKGNVATYGAGEGAEAPGGTPTPPVDMSRGEAGRDSDAPTSHGVNGPSSLPVGTFPPGLIGEVAQFIHDAAPRPVAQIALAGAIGLIAGITGRAYNVSGTGLNNYVLLLAPTGTGKEAIANGISKLMGAIKTSVPASTEFIGPGEIRSDAALLKWLSKAPCFVSTVGEFGLRLKQMSAPNANSHETGLKRVLLDLYNKSGHGNTLNPMAYSDKEKNTDAIQSPAFTLLGESTPERFYEALDESMVSEGLLPRFLTMEYTGPRPPLSTSHMTAQPSFTLVERLATLAAHCLTVAHGGNVQQVHIDQEAQALFDAFDKHADAQINSARSETIRHLWNRAHIKAMKLAALCAVGIYPFNPVVTINEAQWATNIIASEVTNLLAKFEAGEIGSGAVGSSSEVKQIKDMIAVIARWSSGTHDECAKYGVTPDMHRDGVFPVSALTMRLASQAAFRTDRMGATNAIKRAFQHLLDADDIRELPKSQMQMKYGKSARAFIVANPQRFTQSKR